MNTHNKLYIFILASFMILIYSLYVSYSNISLNTNMIKYLQKDQIKLSYLSNKLNDDIKALQVEILSSIAFDTTLNTSSVNNSIDNINSSITRLSHFSRKYAIQSFSQTIFELKDQSKSYELYSQELRNTLVTNKEGETKAALKQFNHITSSFLKTIERLRDITNTDLYANVLDLKTQNEKSSKVTLLSILIALLLLSVFSYKISSLNKELNAELKRAENAEKAQNDLQEQLLQYNNDLEKEVSKKTQELHTKIYTHLLSGLPNRNQLLEDTTQYNFTQIALLNIDKFQTFNDVYGEELGNMALQMSASFLENIIKDTNMNIYHIGGDEFVFTVDHARNNDVFIKDVKSILSMFSQKNFSYQGKEFRFNISAGISFAGKNKILSYADMALKEAKRKNVQLNIYTEEEDLERTHQDDLECHNKLLHAMQTNNVISYFQPIVPLQDSTKPTRYESLVRIKDREENIITPFKFIDVAIANRIYYKITRAVLENTLSSIVKYKVPCSLNISILDIENEKTLAMLYEAFQNFAYNELLTIELLETEEVKDYETVYNFCVSVRSLGIKVALDDFGSGYSNFTHIMKLPLDFIKIDASLISNIDRDTQAQIMVQTIVDLAHKLHIATIAEFVSSQEILDVITSLNVDYSQGFHTGKPQPLEDYITTES